MIKVFIIIICFFSFSVWSNEIIKLKAKFEIKKCFSDDQDNVCSIEYSKTEVIQIQLEKVERSDFLTGTYFLGTKIDHQSFVAEILVNKDKAYAIANYLHSKNQTDPGSVKIDFLGEVMVGELDKLNDISWSGEFVKVNEDFYLPSLTLGPVTSSL